MVSIKTVHVVSAHAEGEVGDVIIEGVEPHLGRPCGSKVDGSQKTKSCGILCSMSQGAGSSDMLIY